ncbi:MAG TPA: hypothetical protein VEF76_09805 [Patescibacteria group bacterium]|nr:hypothetical protein [Patescibacteria group bacterium]
MFNRILFAGLLAAVVSPAFADHPSIGFGGGTAGPILTVPAATLGAGMMAVSFSEEFVKPQRFSDAELIAFAAGHVHAHSVDWISTSAATFSYGLTNDLSLSLRVPYAYRQSVRAGSHTHGGGGVVVNAEEDHGNAKGFGDIGFVGKYRFWNHDGVQAALLLGFEAPTGRDNLQSGGEVLDAEFQPGSGSWDGIFGLAAGRPMGAFSLDGSVVYKLATKGASQTDLGDQVQASIALSHRLGSAAKAPHQRGQGHEHGQDHAHEHHHHHDHGDHPHVDAPQPGGWDVVLELNGEWAAKETIGGVTEENSGGTQIFVSPGLRYAPNANWSGHLSVSVPVFSHLGRGHSVTDYKVTMGIGRAF